MGGPGTFGYNNYYVRGDVGYHDYFGCAFVLCVVTWRRIEYDFGLLGELEIAGGDN